MKSIKIFLFILLQFVSVYSQVVTGIITDTNGVRLAGLSVDLYSIGGTFSAATRYDGSFSFTMTTLVKDENLPTGYNISNNYPNPFNPKTRINFTLPKSANIKIETYNITGQRVRDAIETALHSGNSYIDLELNGLPNGLYFARICIDGNYTITKKLLLLYGSQHLITGSGATNLNLKKTNNDIYIDSIVISGKYIVRTRIKPPVYTAGNNLDLGLIRVVKYDEQYTPCPGIATVKYSGKTYNTVKIGMQCWFKENLNVGIMTKAPQGQTDNNIIEKHCYNDDSANCAAYGGFYKWNEAMQYKTNENAQGICPSGWHIPSNEEYNILIQTVNGNGNSLKAVGQGTGSGEGTNSSGFTMLMAGCSAPYSYPSGQAFANLGYHTYFWTSNGSPNYSGAMILIHSANSVGVYNDNPTQGYSVRCIQDDENLKNLPTIPELFSPPDKSGSVQLPVFLSWKGSERAKSYKLQISESSVFYSFVYNKSDLSDTSQIIEGLINGKTYYWRVCAVNDFGSSAWSGTWRFTTAALDPCKGTSQVIYAGKTYNAVAIGTQCWLKENLDVGLAIKGTQNQTNNGTVEKYCYNDSVEYCIKYGGLYQWAEAVQYKNGATDTTLANPPLTGNVQGICPTGWHIPSLSEFSVLSSTVYKNALSLIAIGQGAGTNESGFSALMAGYKGFYGGSFDGAGNLTYLRSTEEYREGITFCIHLLNNSMNIETTMNYKTVGFSVRCLKD